MDQLALNARNCKKNNKDEDEGDQNKTLVDLERVGETERKVREKDEWEKKT